MEVTREKCQRGQTKVPKASPAHLNCASESRPVLPAPESTLEAFEFGPLPTAPAIAQEQELKLRSIRSVDDCSALRAEADGRQYAGRPLYFERSPAPNRQLLLPVSDRLAPTTALAMARPEGVRHDG